MSRRISLPGANELFRSTRDEVEDAAPPVTEAFTAAGPGRAQQLLAQPLPQAGPDRLPDLQANHVTSSAPRAVASTGRRRVLPDAEHRPTGRERHDEKITVYVSPEELMDLERARLTLRGDHGLAVDRGRIVREALAVVLADLADKGEASILVRRLRGL